MSNCLSIAVVTLKNRRVVLAATLSAWVVVVTTISTIAPAAPQVATRYHARQRTERFYQRQASVARGMSIPYKAMATSARPAAR